MQLATLAGANKTRDNKNLTAVKYHDSALNYTYGGGTLKSA